MTSQNSDSIKAALRAFKFDYININEKKFGIDGKWLKVLKVVRKKTIFLKSVKGQGVLLLKLEDYTNIVEMMLTDRNKLKRIVISWWDSITSWKLYLFRVILVHIFLHSDWIGRDPNAVKYGLEKLRKRTFFMQWILYKIMSIYYLIVVKLTKSRSNYWDLKHRKLVELADYLKSTSHFNCFLNFDQQLAL